MPQFQLLLYFYESFSSSIKNSFDNMFFLELLESLNVSIKDMTLIVIFIKYLYFVYRRLVSVMHINAFTISTFCLGPKLKFKPEHPKFNLYTRNNIPGSSGCTKEFDYERVYISNPKP